MNAEEYTRLAEQGGKHAKLFRDMAQWCMEEAGGFMFSDEEIAIIRMLRSGVPRVEMAVRLNISEAMVSRRLLNIWKLLGEPRTNDAGLVYQLGRRGICV